MLAYQWRAPIFADSSASRRQELVEATGPKLVVVRSVPSGTERTAVNWQSLQVTGSKLVVVHFYHNDFESCKVAGPCPYHVLTILPD